MTDFRKKSHNYYVYDKKTRTHYGGYNAPELKRWAKKVGINGIVKSTRTNKVYKKKRRSNNDYGFSMPRIDIPRW